MVYKKQPEGTQRTLIYNVRLRPNFKQAVEKKLAWMRSHAGWEKATVSDLIRVAVEAYCKDDQV